MKELIVATGNPGKLAEMQAYLRDLPLELQLKPPEIEIEETGQTFRENAILKAVTVAKATGKNAIADDSGLRVDALNGAPGIYSARYGNTDRERIARLLRELGDNPNRAAEFVCAVAIAAPDGSILVETEGKCQGEILYSARGDGGFGYDPIFYVLAAKQTFAEMRSEFKRKISHRGQAFAKLMPLIRSIEL
ncbi:MAG: RdgB/HAM1 family non-canonical purine NTP pyrophosphatase [Prochloraceae cyanobacterium]